MYLKKTETRKYLDQLWSYLILGTYLCAIMSQGFANTLQVTVLGKDAGYVARVTVARLGAWTTQSAM